MPKSGVNGNIEKEYIKRDIKIDLTFDSRFFL